MSATKLQPTHLDRLAVVYVRQSSPLQVERHQESQRRQYQLAERAAALGWPGPRCLVIDDDLGISGAHSANRPGYQRLVSLVALREVGVIFSLEVSRLARNSLDWYQLLELAAAFAVLIGDEDGLYDPGDFNDRLLLGLKGTFSEIERYQINARMQRGRLNKVRRGEYAVRLPVGFEYDALTGELVVTPDQAVRHALEQVFHLFAQLGSVRAVLYYLLREGLELPHRVVRRGLGSRVQWQPPSYDALYHYITNPVYAGVYCYGRRTLRRDPVARSQQVVRRPREAWEVFLPDHHPGYLTLGQYEENMARLHNNRSALATGQGAPREGSALLQGLAVCQRCGRRMRVRYHQGSPYYCCDKAHVRFGAPICGWGSATRVDALVEDLVLDVIDAGAVDLALAADEEAGEEQARLDRRWREQLQRLEYEAKVAQERYELVDPANRLVAQTLETAWNDRLVALEAARAEFQRRQHPPAPASTPSQMREMLGQLPLLWHGARVGPQDKKALLRCVIAEVRLATDGPVIRAEVVWQGGARSHLDVPKYLGGSSAAYHRNRDLAQRHTDREIADRLNAAGLPTMKGKPWTARRVLDFRRSNAIPSGLTASAVLRLPASGYLSSAEVAACLAVEQTRVQKWFQLGVLAGKQDARQKPLWIAWDAETARRLDGRAPLDERMVSVKRLCRQLGKSADAVLSWAVAEGHTVYRVRRNTTYRFYILPREACEHGPDGKEGAIN
jgi:DNA invertase Pin-like site-specific DNA recombinase